MKKQVLIYGASGYTGKLLAAALLKNGITPILAGRSNTIREIGQKLKCPVKIFDLSKQNDIVSNLEEVMLLVNLAGSFSHSQKPLIEACLLAKTHYIDIAGEVPEMETAFSYDLQAQKAGILILAGAGFGVVPTDIAANLAKNQLPDANSLVIAYATEGGASRGTLKTVLKDINKQGVIRKNGKLIAAMPASEQDYNFSFGKKQFKAVYNPWRADLFTAFISTNVSNISTYSVFPSFVVSMMRGKLLWLRNLLLNHLINFLPEGPSEKELLNGRTYIEVIATNLSGKTAKVQIEGLEAYDFTTQILVQICKSILNRQVVAGAKTPFQFEPKLLEKIEGVKISITQN
jgi:short subunit dehydrogenase-like uncharacterized protein